ncbi:MAG: hypothetical protein ACFE0J_08360 [Elainellaceae cyanobacterium]
MKSKVPQWIQQNWRRRRISLFLKNFALGTLVGYGLGILRVHTKVLYILQVPQPLESQVNFSFIQVAWDSITYLFNTFPPSLEFASDVIAYQAAIIAIAIPLSLEIISRISERYQSGVITKEFNQQWQLRVLLALVITGALLGVTLKFFVDAEISTAWKFAAWITFLIFFATNFVLFAFFNNLRKYSTQTKFLLNKLFDDVTQTLNKITSVEEIGDDGLRKFQGDFIDALEGIGDVLVFETKNRKNSKYIIEGLEKIQVEAQNFVSLKATWPERYEKLLYSHELLQLAKEDKLEASLRLHFFPRDYSLALMALVNQFLRVRETALEVSNLEIAQLTTYHLIRMLKALSRSINQGQPIETLLTILTGLGRADLNHGSPQIHNSLASITSIEWYVSTILDNSFKLEYLSLFNQYFFPVIRQIISDSNTQLFELFIKRLYDSGEISSCDQNYIGEGLQYVLPKRHQVSEEISNQLEQIELKLGYLKRLVSRINSVKEYSDCTHLLDEVKELIHGHVQTDEVQQQLDRLHDELLSCFKFSHVVNLLFDIGAYCIFKERYDYIKYFWSYRQPHDSDAICVGNEFVPTSLSELFSFYFTGKSILDFPVSWEGHRGKRRYYDQYFLLLLLREFMRDSSSGNRTQQDVINKFRLPRDFDYYYLNNVHYEVDRLIPLAKELPNLSQKLQELGFESSQINNAIQNDIIPFLKNLKPKADERLDLIKRKKKVSAEKIHEFKLNFLEGYNKFISIRELFYHWELYKDKTHMMHEDSTKFGFNKIVDKSLFLEKWYVHSDNLGCEYGKNTARSENSHLLTKLMQACDTNIKDLEDAIKKLIDGIDRVDNIIIIGINAHLYNLLNNPEQCKWKGEDDGLDLKMHGFEGSYIYKDHLIPIFEYPCQIPEDENFPDGCLLILDKTRLGKLIQYNPVSLNGSYQIEKYFAFRIKAFAEDEALMAETLMKAPDWLLEKGDESQQKAYLESYVLLEIYERFDLEISSDFIGFIIPYGNDLS